MLIQRLAHHEIGRFFATTEGSTRNNTIVVVKSDPVRDEDAKDAYVGCATSKVVSNDSED